MSGNIVMTLCYLLMFFSVLITYRMQTTDIQINLPFSGSFGFSDGFSLSNVVFLSDSFPSELGVLDLVSGFFSLSDFAISCGGFSGSFSGVSKDGLTRK